jgi:hypothetical protein
MMAEQPTQPTAEPPVYNESIGGALIDSARISVMAALHVLPPPPNFARIVLPGDEDEPPVIVQECLEQAMQWLNRARELTVIQSGVPPTSLHVVTGGT